MYQAKTSCLVGLAGFEPATSSLSVTRSNQLSYSPILSRFSCKQITMAFKLKCLTHHLNYSTTPSVELRRAEAVRTADSSCLSAYK